MCQFRDCNNRAEEEIPDDECFDDGEDEED